VADLVDSDGSGPERLRAGGVGEVSDVEAADGDGYD